ncbi:protein far1-related sequence 5-like [Gigaspora margarita]|uniref:Protein far1-related sequence 5-like n=1 Tax=Gigaspora margarita TaxID=4874 RepID=A0A8H3XL83_GIGMA|nr:protein far1-related sequence 5-like [Gigaspora margarita]
MECEDNLRQMEYEDNLETLAEQSSSVVICPRNSSVSYAAQNIKMEFVEAIDMPVNTKQYYDENSVSNVDKAVSRYLFLPQDISNAIQTFKRQNHVECEAAVLLNYLLERKAKNTRWVVNWKVDPTNNSLVSLFWMSPDQHDLYLRYRDVVQHDNIYSTNRFKMALGFLVIVDNNNRSRLVGQALMSDETVESYEWVFQTLIMNTRAAPLMIITDNDLAVNTTIANVLSDSYHIHCIFHIGQNLIKNLKGKLGERYNELSTYWYQMRNSLSYNRFDDLWNELLKKFPDAASYLNRVLYGEKQRWAFCYISRVFTAGMQSTQRVEGQNAIIKSSVNGSTLTHASSEFSLDIDKWITTYLIQASLSMQRQEIAQAIWYTSQCVNNIQDLAGLQLDSIEKVDLSTQCNLDEQSNIFVEDTVDAPAILIQELLSSTEVDSILEIRKVTQYRRKAKNYVVLFKNNSHLCTCLGLIRCEISFSDIHAKVSYCKAYVTANSLLKKAIQIGLDAGSSAIQELEDLMNSFITKYALKKRKKLVNEKHIEQQEVEDEYISNSSSSDKDFVVVKNPIVHSRRGAPRKKRFKGSYELESNKSKQNVEGQKARKATQCQQCQNTGHNKTGCEAWHK